MTATPAQQPQPVRPTLLRDIFVQAVGSALGVGLVAVVGIAYGFIDVHAPDRWVRATVAVLMTLLGFITVMLTIGLVFYPSQRTRFWQFAAFLAGFGSFVGGMVLAFGD